MKRLFLTLILAFLSIVLIGDKKTDDIIINESLVENQYVEIYRDFGTANFPVNPTTTTSIQAYVTKTSVNNSNQKGLVHYSFQYEIMVISYSRVNNVRTNTNMYGVRVFVNGVETSAKTFPNGFNVLVLTEPTMIYWLETNDPFPEIRFKWQNVIYQTLK